MADFKGMKYGIYFYSTEIVSLIALVVGFIAGLLYVKYKLPVWKPFRTVEDKSAPFTQEQTTESPSILDSASSWFKDVGAAISGSG